MEENRAQAPRKKSYLALVLGRSVILHSVFAKFSPIL